MAYEIIHEQAEHWQTLGEYQTLEEATVAFNSFLEDWEVEEDDQYLELRFYDEEVGDVTEEEILIYYLTPPETWVY